MGHNGLVYCIAVGGGEPVVCLERAWRVVAGGGTEMCRRAKTGLWSDVVSEGTDLKASTARHCAAPGLPSAEGRTRQLASSKQRAAMLWNGRVGCTESKLACAW